MIIERCSYTRLMRHGILGGTFDPIHHGHLVVAAEARAQLRLDEVLLIPAGDPWQKRGQVVASGAHRLAMAQLGVHGVVGLRVSPVEVDHEGASVTADTLEALGAPDGDFVVLLGADAAANMPTWRRLEATRRLAAIAVVERAGERTRNRLGPDGVGTT